MLEKVWMKSSIKFEKSLMTSGNDESLDQCENRQGQLGVCQYIHFLCTKTSGWRTQPFAER